MKVLKISQMKQTPWKNGLGLTTEIAIEPKTAIFPMDPFLWRMSCAEITSNNQFSKFLGYERILLVWKGPGFVLNNKSVQTFEVVRFSGSDEVFCEMVGDKVLDLGIIYLKDKVQCYVKVLSADENKTHQLGIEKGSRNFLLCAEGSVKVMNQVLVAGEIVDLKDTASIELVYLSKSHCVLVEIKIC
jgi:uncharacterized protein